MSTTPSDGMCHYAKRPIGKLPSTAGAVGQNSRDGPAAAGPAAAGVGHLRGAPAGPWGTVVAYEALRQLEDEGLQAPLVRNFFTVGAALSIGPVKMQLRGANKNGKKPASVRRWVNLNAHGDLIGGALKGRPYDDDIDIIKLPPFGCNSLLGLVNPGCAHSSCFVSGNVAVNRDIFANYIGQP